MLRSAQRMLSNVHVRPTRIAVRRHKRLSVEWLEPRLMLDSALGSMVLGDQIEPFAPAVAQVTNLDAASQQPRSEPLSAAVDPVAESTGEPSSGSEADENFWQNPDNPFDVDGVDGATANDLLTLITRMNRQLGNPSLPPKYAPAPPFFDVNGDGISTGEDILDVIDELTRLSVSLDNPESSESAATDILDQLIPASKSAIAETTAVVGSGSADSVTPRSADAACPSGSACASIQTQPIAAPNDSPLRIDLLVTDLSGTPTSTLELSQQFLLHVVVDDLRNSGQGVFSAYADVAFASDLASVSGPLVFSDQFPNAQSGRTDVPDIIDEVGAFGGIQPLGADPMLLVSIPFQAESTGSLSFTSDSADLLPNHEVTLYGLDHPIESDDIDFGSITVNVIG